MAKKILSVYIGRFQPLHLGHVHILQQALASSDQVLVLVGSSFTARTIKDPFTFAERADMISDWFSTTLHSRSRHVSGETLPTLTVLPIRDQRYNNAKWIQSVQESVDLTILNSGWKNEKVEVRLTGSDRDHSTWYLSAFPQYVSDLKDPVPPGALLNATQLRHRLFKFNDTNVDEISDWLDVPNSTSRFLAHFIRSPEYRVLKAEYEFMEMYKEAWVAAPYAPTFVTVDAVVVQSGHVLVVKRGALPGEGLWALPGGFLGQTETLMQAACRELIEETGIRLAEGKKAKELTMSILQGSVKAKEVFDDPTRSLRGRTVTTCFLIRLDDTKSLPKVRGQFAPPEDVGGKEDVIETADAFWLPIADARAHSDLWFEDHLHIMEVMLGMIKD